MPKAERPAPPFVQIADYYRQKIKTGELRPGERLPAISQIARDWDVSPATAAKAVGQLQVEGAVTSTTQGTYVSADDRVTRSPGERIRARFPVRPGPGAGEEVTVTAAGIVTAPDYVAGLLHIDIGAEVIRREEIVTRHGRPLMLTVDWIPGASAMMASELLAPEPIDGGPEHVIETMTGRKITHAEDHLEGRGVRDARESGALGKPIGAPCLAGVHIWSDNEDPLLYGEWLMPSGQVISYAYEVAS